MSATSRERDTSSQVAHIWRRGVERPWRGLVRALDGKAGGQALFLAPPWPGHTAPAWASHTQAVPDILEDPSCPEPSAPL